MTALGLLGADANAIARGETQDPAVGWWRGYAVYRESRLDITIHVLVHGATLEATLSSPDMMLLEQPLAGVRHDGRHFRFTTRDERPLRFDGLVEGDSIRGSAAVPPVPGVTKPGETTHTMRFVLGRAPAPGALPYKTREVSFASGSARLVGTLFMPESSGPHAAVVLLQGSSSNRRQEYRFIADHFARTGLVVLAFDKRGNGKSSGDYSAATYEDLVGDACAAITCLSAQRELDARRVGVWGLSQGGFIAPSVAAHVPSLRFIVAVSAPGVPIGECAAYQDSVRLVSADFGPADVRQAVSLDRSILEWLRTGRGERELSERLAAVADTPWRRASSVPPRLPSGPSLEGWYWRGRTVDPAPWWHAVHVPVLAIYGAADERIPAQASAARIERSLRAGADRDVTVRTFPAANHELRILPLVAGGKWDWPRAAPGYLDLVTTWMLEHSKPPDR